MSSPQTPSRRPPLLNQSSFSSLSGLEKSIPPTPSSAGNFSNVPPDDLNRPLPPLPIVPRKASSIYPTAPRKASSIYSTAPRIASSINPVAQRRASSIYSVQDEDIIDYYTNSNPYNENVSPFDFVPPTVGNTLKDLYEREGSVASPASYPEQLSPDFYRPDPEPRERPEWTLESPRTRSSVTRHHLLPSPNLRSESPNASSRFTSIDLTADAASAIPGNRPASPQVRSAPGMAASGRNSQDGGLRVPSPGFRKDSGSSSLRPVSPKTLPSSPKRIPSPMLPRTGQPFLFPEPLSGHVSTASSMRSVSPLSHPKPTHNRRQKQLPPPPINVRRKDSDISPSPSPTLPDPATVHYSHEHNYPNGPLASRISDVEDYALVPGSLHSSKLVTPTTFQSDYFRPTPPSTGHTSPASFAHPLSFTDTTSFADGSTSPKWPYDAFFENQSPTDPLSHGDIHLPELSPRLSQSSRPSSRPANSPRPTYPLSPRPSHSSPRPSYSPSPRASHSFPRPSYSPSPRPSHPSFRAPQSSHHRLPSHPPPTPSETRRILTAFSEKYPSTAPPPPSTRLRSYASSTRASISTRFSDIYGTLSSLSHSPQKTSPTSPDNLASVTEKPYSPVSPFTPLTATRPLAFAAQGRAGSIPREIHRSPAIPITPYQYMGAKAFEAAEPPKFKAKKKEGKTEGKDEGKKEKGGSPRRIGRIASLLEWGRGKEEMGRARARVELKKKIVVLGVGGVGGQAG